VLPDELEKHCIEAAPNVDKTGSASKKAAFAHAPLWICRRFSTIAMVLHPFGRLNLSVCHTHQLPVISLSGHQVIRSSAIGKQLPSFLAPVSAIPLPF
jgi:hypothetical protein